MNETLMLDNAKLYCFDGIHWMAKNIAVTNNSTFVIGGEAYLGGCNDA